MNINKFMRVAPYFYGAAMAAFGVIQLVTQNFLSSLLQVPPTSPLRWISMLLSSAIFILTGLSIVFNIRRQLALVAVGTLLAIFLLALQLPALLMNLHNANDWAVTFEGVMLTSGAFIIAAGLPDETLISRRWNRTIQVLAMIGHYLFALSLFVFCIQHIMYFDYILSLIPTWMPVRMVLDYVVVVGYLLCGISFVIGQRVGLAATWLGIMFFLWILLLHAPRALGKWNVETEWTSLFVALAVCGVAFSVARRDYGRHGRPARIVALQADNGGESGMSFVAKGQKT
jgi:uncharacterized membrane protein YphA (DoxX/SURF4 family)